MATNPLENVDLNAPIVADTGLRDQFRMEQAVAQPMAAPKVTIPEVSPQIKMDDVLRAQMERAKMYTPEQVAKSAEFVANTRTELEVEPWRLAAHTAMIDKATAKASMDAFIATGPNSNPTLTGWLAKDPVNASLAQDELDKLSAYERFWRAGYDAVLASGEALPGLVQAGAGSMRLVNETLGNRSSADDWAFVFDEAQKVRDELASKRTYRGFVGDAISMGVTSTVQMAPGLVASLLTMNPIPAAAWGAYITGGSVAGQNLKDNVPLANTWANAATQAAVEFFFEKIPLSRLINDVGGHASFFKMLRGQLLTEIPTEIGTTWAQDFSDYVFANPDKTFGEYVRSMPETAAQTAIATLVGATLQTGITRTATMKRAGAQEPLPEAGKAALDAEKIAEQVKGLKLTERSPVKLREFTEQLAGNKSFYVNADEAAVVLNQLPDDAMARIAQYLPDLANQIAEAVVTRTDVKIPQADYAAFIAPHTDGLIEHLKNTPNPLEMSRAEAAALKTAAAADPALAAVEKQDREVRRTMANDPTYATSIRVIQGSLVEAGRTGVEARALAPLWAARLARKAQIDGKSLLETVTEFGQVAFRTQAEDGSTLKQGSFAGRLVNEIDAYRADEERRLAAEAKGENYTSRFNEETRTVLTQLSQRLEAAGVSPAEAMALPPEQLSPLLRPPAPPAAASPIDTAGAAPFEMAPTKGVIRSISDLIGSIFGKDAAAQTQQGLESVTISLTPANIGADTAATPGIMELSQLAEQGDKASAAVLQALGAESLLSLLSGIPSVQVNVVESTGMYGNLEPSLAGTQVSFLPEDRAAVLAALSQFGKTFNQSSIHIRQYVEYNEQAVLGEKAEDGSYITPVIRATLTRPLTRQEIEEIVKEADLPGVTVGDNYVESYYVNYSGPDADTEAGAEEFRAKQRILTQALNSRGVLSGFQEGLSRIWSYGSGADAISGYDTIAGDVPAAKRGIPSSLSALLAGERFAGRQAVAGQATKLTPEQADLQRRIAADYEAMPDNDLSNPLVEEAYRQLVKELKAIYPRILAKVEVWAERGPDGQWVTRKSDPYKQAGDKGSEASRRMIEDVVRNNHIYIYGTDKDSFGPQGVDFSFHPLLEDSGFADINGYPLKMNDLLRAVHDYFAHASSGSTFGALGEEAAWKNHMGMSFSPLARWALTSETRGQNSWVNFDPENSKKQWMDDWSDPNAKQFARQKAALLPVQYLLGSANEQVEKETRDFIASLTPEQRRGSLRGAPEQVDDVTLFQSANNLNDLGFFSKMTSVLEQKLNATGTARQFLEQVRGFAGLDKDGKPKPGAQVLFKKEELDWSGLEEHLEELATQDEQLRRNEPNKITKASVLKVLETFNSTFIEEVGENSDTATAALDLDSSDFIDDGTQLIEDDDYVQQNADELYDDILKQLKDENKGLPEDEQETEDELKKRAAEEAYEQAKQSYIEDDSSYEHRWYLSHVEVSESVEVRYRDSDGYNLYINGEYQDTYRSLSSAATAAEEYLVEDFGYSRSSEDGPDFEQYTAEGGNDYRFYRLRVTKPLIGGVFEQGGHYPEENVVAHYRTKARKGPNGERMLFIEEAQSDLHQAAYKAASAEKKKGIADATGYLSDNDATELAKLNEQRADISERSYQLTRKINEIEADNNDKFISSARDEAAVKLAELGLPSEMIDSVTYNMRVPGDHYAYMAGKDRPPPTMTFFDRAFSKAMFYIMNTPRVDDDLQATDASPSLHDYHFRRFVGVIDSLSLDGAFEDFDALVNRAVEQAFESFEGDTIKGLYGIYAREAKKLSFLYIGGAQTIKMMDEIKASSSGELNELNLQRSQLGIEREKLTAKITAYEDKVPLAPFVKTWRELLFKRLMSVAVRDGFQSIGWTTGSQQNARYKLSNFIKALYASKSTEGGEVIYRLTGDGNLNEAARRAELPSVAISNNILYINATDLEKLVGATGLAQIDEQAPPSADANEEAMSYIDFDKPLEVQIAEGDKRSLYDSVMPLDARSVVKKLDPSIKPELVKYETREQVGDRKRFDQIWYMPINDTMREKIRANGFELFQGGQDPRGFINMTSNLQKVVTTFTKKANLSTASHEFGHFSVELHRMMAQEYAAIPQDKRTPDQQVIIDDWAKLKRWAGATSDVFSTEAHEKVADGFVAYLREGRAPSRTLASTFKRFKDWLVAIYKDVSGLGVELDDEVRGVFDRWIATTEEVEAAAERDIELEEIAAMLDEPGAPISFELASLLAQSKAEAEEDIASELSREESARQTKKYRAERDRLKKEARAELLKQPVYGAAEYLRTNGYTMMDGLGMEGVPADLLSGDEDALHPDVVADLFGFESGAALVKALRDTPNIEYAASRMATERLRQTYGDMVADGRIKSVAELAVRNERSLLALDLLVKEMSRRSDKGETSMRTLASAIAKQRLVGTQMRDLGPTRYEAARKKHMKLALQESRKGNWIAALDAMQIVMVNEAILNQLAEIEKMKERAEKLFGMVNRRDSKLPSSWNYDFVKMSRWVLSRVGMSNSEIDGEAWIAEKLEQDPDLADQLVTLANVGSIPQKKDASRLTVAEYEKVYDAVVNLIHVGRNLKELETAERKISTEKALNELVEQAGKSFPGRQPPPLSSTDSWFERKKNSILDFEASLIRIEQFTRWLDNGTDGPFTKYIWQPVRQAADRSKERRRVLLSELTAIVQPHEKRLGAGPISAPELVTYRADGSVLFNGRFASKFDMLSMLLNLGNESSKRVFLQGWGLTESKVYAAIEKYLTPEDVALAQQIWDFLERMKPLVKEEYRIRTGLELAEVEPTPVTIFGRTFRGGYYPLIADRREAAGGIASAQVDPRNMLFDRAHSPQYPAPTRGFQKERTGAVYPVSMNIMGAFRHVEDVAHNYEVGPALMQVARIVNFRRARPSDIEGMPGGVEQPFLEALGRINPFYKSRDMWQGWLQSVARDTVNDIANNDTSQKIGEWLRTRTIMMLMGLNLSNALQNYSSVPVAMREIGVGAFLDGYGKYLRGPKDATEMVMRYSLYMRNRWDSLDRDTQEIINSIKVGGGAVAKGANQLRLLAFALQNITDRQLSVPVWIGAYNKALAAGKGESAAVARADQAVRTAIASGDVADTSAVQRGQFWKRAATMLYGYMGMMYNRNRADWLNYRRGDISVFEFAAANIVTNIMPNLLAAAIVDAIGKGGAAADDEDKELSWYMSRVLSGYFGLIPFVRDIGSLVTGAFGGSSFGDKVSFSPLGTPIDTAIKTVMGLMNGYHREDMDWSRVAQNTIMLGGAAANVPVGMFRDFTATVVDWMEGDSSPDNPLEAIQQLTGGPPPKQR